MAGSSEQSDAIRTGSIDARPCRGIVTLFYMYCAPYDRNADAFWFRFTNPIVNPWLPLELDRPIQGPDDLRGRSLM
jgi:hypothetical protein